MKKAVEYATAQVEHIAPYWLGADGELHMPRRMMADYLALAFTEGGLSVIKELKAEPVAAEVQP